jgi:hypothetical protein
MSTLGVCVHGFLLASLTKLTTMHFFFFFRSEHVLSASALMCIFKGPNESPVGRSSFLCKVLVKNNVSRDMNTLNIKI